MQPQPVTSQPSCAPPLRAFTGRLNPAPWSGAPSSRMTLVQFYCYVYRERILDPRQPADRNLDQYEESLTYWRRFTGDPPLDQVDDGTTAQFVKGLAGLSGSKPGSTISNNTIRKHCRSVQAVLDKTGPRGTDARTRKAQGLLSLVPYIEKPPARRKPPTDGFAVAEITRILHHCQAALAPAYLDVERRALWWRCLFVFDYNVALRIGSLLDVRWDRLETDADGLHWLVVPVKGGDVRRIHVNAPAWAAIEALRPITAQAASGHVWHWPHVQSWLQANRRKILAAAGLPPHRRFGFHGLRKANATEASRIDPFAAQLQLGHSTPRTTNEHYVNPARVADGMSKLPQPTAPQKRRQLELF